VGRCLDIALNLIGLLGVLLLAAPAFYAAKYGILVARLKTAGPIDPNNAEAVKIHEDTLKELADHQSEWTPLLSRCLKAGTFCAGVSYLLGFVKALIT
jgi:hypothetical protein